MSKIGNSAESDLHAVIEPTRIPNLRLQVWAVNIRSDSRPGPVEFRGKLKFPATRSAGVRELYRSCDVEGQFSAYAWGQMTAFHNRLFVADGKRTSPVELIAGRAILELPRASVTETESGFAAVAVLRVFVDDVECARIPRHRWRVYSAESGRTGDPALRYHPDATLH